LASSSSTVSTATLSKPIKGKSSDLGRQ
jgi:hypothetical protein